MSKPTWTEAEHKAARLLRAFDRLCDAYHEAIDKGEDSLSLDEIASVLQTAEYGKEIHIIGGNS